MLRKRKLSLSLTVFMLTFLLCTQAAFASSHTALKNGMSGNSVSKLQKDLKNLGYMDISPTGYFGDMTQTAVSRLQKKYGLSSDGVAGAQTLGKIDKLLGRSSSASRGTVSLGQRIIDYAKRFLGVDYVWGGNTPDGFDCSGFVKYVYGKFGIYLDRVSTAQATQGTVIKKSNLLPGDLVFFDTNGGHNRINHVGLYIGSGKFIQASSGYSNVVISDLTEGFYAESYMTARRVR